MSRRALLRLAATFVVVTAAPAEPAEDSGSRAEYRRAYTEAFDSEQHELAAELAGSRLAELGERGPPLERSAALGDLGWALLERFRWQDARAAFDQARELRANAGAPANREHATLLLGLASATMPDDPDAAEPLFREALHVFRQAGGQDDPDGWWTWKRLADLRAATDAEAAEAMLREAVAGLARTDPAGLRLSTARRALAGQVARRGDSVEAESLRRTTLEDLRSKVHPDHSQIAGLLNGLGEIRHRRGEHAAAEELYLEALERARRRLGDRHPHVFTYLNNVAAVRTAAGRLPESESAFRELVALIGTAKGKEDAQVGSVLGGLGWNLVQQGRYAEADSVLAHALEVRRRATSEDDSWVSSIQEYRVRVAYFQGEYGRAEERLGELLERYRRKSGNTNRRVQSALEGLGVMAASRADFQGAVNYLEESARLFETLRLRSARGAGRATFAGSPYERLAALHLELGSGERAWEAAERLRGLTLADLLLAASERPLTPEEEAREDELAAELSRRESSMEAARAEFVTAGDDEGRMLYETEFGELLAAEAKWFAFQEEIVARYPVREGRTFPLARVQAALAPDEAVVGWVDAGITRQRPVSWAYVLRSAGPVHWEPLENALQSGRGHATRSPTVAAFREELRAPARRLLPTPADAVLGAARGVWKERLGPLEPHLDGVSALVIVPSRIMTGVPVEALPDAEDVLVGDRYSVTYA
ncbi:MAG TPA: tetratricopeptide repeat protein, partial [bacterium]|nr:tetratricopeptide repeat protein [bacterium]